MVLPGKGSCQKLHWRPLAWGKTPEKPERDTEERIYSEKAGLEMKAKNKD